MTFNQDFAALGVGIVHHMPNDGSKIYVKETLIPAGDRLTMHQHTFTHKSVLCKGSVVLSCGPARSIVDAPAVLSIRQGMPHEVEALQDSVWLCIHATEECDPERIDEALVEVSA